MPPTASQTDGPTGSGAVAHSQRALWWAQQLQPQSSAFNIFAAVECDLPFDRARVTDALDAMVASHTALRVCLPARHGRPRRRVHGRLTIPWEVVEATGWDEARLRREVYAFAERPFDLARGPLFRARFYLRGTGFSLLFAAHHSVLDFTSLCLLSVELIERCRASAAGRSFPETRTDDATFAAWEAELIESARAEQHLAYWRELLTDPPPRLELPVDYGSGATRDREARDGPPLRRDLNPAQYRRLVELADAAGGSLYTLLMATAGAWTARLCGQEDLILGTTLSQRRNASLRPLIGPLLNTVPLRLRVDPTLTWRAWHATVKRAVRNAVRHGAAPFPWVAERLPRDLYAGIGPPRLESLTPLVVNFAAARFGDAPGRPHYWAQCGASTDLMVTAYDVDQGLNLNFNYDANRFAGATVAALADSLCSLLAALPDHVDDELGRLPLSAPGAADQRLRGPSRPLPATLSHQIVAQRAADDPERAAVSHAGTTLSYAELDWRVNGVAHRLVTAGVAPGEIVGLLAPRGPDLIAAVLGTLHAGAAFLPLDAQHPAARWRTLVHAAEARHLIIAEDLVATFGTDDGIELHPLAETIASPLAARDETPRDAGDLAYVMFTSGSTGRPKGVMVEHLGMLNHNLAKIEVTELGPEDVLLQSASPGFVISVWQMLAPLMVGARVHIVDDELLADPPVLCDEIRRAGVTVVQTVPSLLALWLQHDAADALAGLRLMISTGEALSPELARRWLRRFPGVPLLNAYGPTECSDDVAHARLVRPPLSGTARLPIGEPIANVQIAVCDANLEPLPPGVPGEICVTGHAVARGYVNVPADTTTGFCRIPERLYRTGDRGRRRVDGGLEYLGRVDDQIKIRGQRIELGEVEAVMAEAPGIRAAAARLWRSARDEPLLVGYVVADPAQAAGSRLEAWLAARLPPVARPARLIPLDRLPLNRNGKLDRGALPPPDRRAAPRAPPRNPRETALAGIWQQLLHLAGPDALGVDDDFFALGGHSLLLMELQQRLVDAFGVTLPVAELFELPTIAALSARLAAAGPHRSAAAERIPISASASSGAPLSAVQERFFVLEQLRPQSPQLNLAAAMRLGGELRLDVLEAAFADLFARHEALRTRFGFAAGRPYQVVEPVGLAAPVLQFAADGGDLSSALDQAVAAARRGFDVSRAPLVRIELFRLADDDHLLVVVAHHLICDGWSVDLLIRDSLTLYDARLRGREAGLPAVEAQLTDYARWEVARTDDAFSADLDYWRQRLAGAAPLELPTATSAGGAQAQRMEVCQRRLYDDSLTPLRALARAERTSLFRVLLTSLSGLLARLCGQLDVTVAVTAALRDRPELQQTVGFLVNTVMLRADLSGDPTFTATLRQLHARGIEAAKHQSLPFERLLRVLQREAITAGGLSPLQTYLTFNQREADRYEQGDLTLELVDLPPPSPFVDLSFCADESPRHLDLRATYDADQFTEVQVDQILDQWRQGLAAVAREPELRLSELPLTPPSRALPNAEGPRAARPLPWTDGSMAGTVGARFAEVVTACGDQPAVTTAEGSLTYAELDTAARHLAARLAVRGGRGERVALLFHNDALLAPVGILGALLAGQVFVPLDATHPDRRLDEVIASAEPVALVFDPALAERAAGLVPGELLVPVTGDETAASAMGWSSDRATPLPEDLAYVMFTSGSTGRPKGVVQHHRNVLHFARAYGDVLGGVGPGDRISLLANAAHDAGLMDVFLALLHGATLYPLDVRRRGLTESLAWLRDAGITLAHTTPTFFRAWVGNLDDAGAPPTMRAVTFDGEPSLRQDVELFARHFPESCWLINCYGSTESSISMRAVVRDAAGLPARPAFSLEGPVDRTDVTLETAAGEQTALYGIGEVVVTSRYVTPGYWRAPELDAAVFEQLVDGRRRYRSGDLGRWLPGGRIEIVGRRDRQIKILGQRVELNEIETRVRELCGARDCCVIHRQLRAGHQRLEAYVGGPCPDFDEVRVLTELAATLPPFMVPQRCKRLDRIPRTPNTKIDNAALLRAAEAFDDDATGEAPATRLEERLADHWREILGLAQPAADQSFFDLGGDSLQLLELHHRLRAEGFELDVVELFRHPTLRSLAERLSEGSAAADDSLVDRAKARGARRRAARRSRRG